MKRHRSAKAGMRIRTIKDLSSLLIILLFINSHLCLLNQVLGEVELSGEAHFINNFPDLKIYDKSSVDIEFAIRNVNSSEEDFVIYFFRDSLLIYRESISCKKDTTSKYFNAIISEGWVGPKNYQLIAELRTLSGTIQDHRKFSVHVVKLLISNWDYSIDSIITQSNEYQNLTLSFRNGGNDLMYNVTISPKDTRLFDIDPKSLEIQIVPIGKTTNIEYKIRALNSTEPGNYSITLKISYYDFEGEIHEEEKSIPIDVIKLETKIVLNYSSNLKFGHKIDLSARLFDIKNNSIKDEEIVFFLGDSNIGTSETDSSGTALLEYEPVNLEVGEYNVTAYYYGSENFKNSTSTASIIIIPLQTRLNIEMPNSTIAKETSSFRAIIKDEDGVALSDKLIWLYIDGFNISNSTTDDRGIAFVIYTFQKSGNFSINAAFKGEKNYLGSESNVWTINVDLMPTFMSLDMESAITKGNPINIRVRLWDKYGTGIEKGKINFYFNDEMLKSSLTNKDGFSSINFTSDSSGIIDENTIIAEYEGDETYQNNTIRKKFTVIDIRMLIAIMILIIVGATVALIILIMKYKKRAKLPSEKPSKVVDNIKCINCGKEISASETYCPFCGHKKETAPEEIIPIMEPIDEKVYDYMVKNEGTISWEKASKELNISKEQLIKSVDKLKKAGKIAPANGEKQ